MTIEIRKMREDEFLDFAECQAITFNRDWRPEATDLLQNRREIQELPRSIIAKDGGQAVGTASAFTYDMATPGGSVECGGLTMVSVRSTHRRRGVLTEMMRQHFEDVRDHGEPVSALWAAESIIYGRYGYGVATQSVDVRIEREHARIEHMPPLRGQLRMMQVDDVRETWPAFYDRVRAGQPGMMPRTPTWWRNRIFFDNPAWRGAMTGNRYVNYEVDGEIAGVLRYRVQDKWELGVPDGLLKVEELLATSDEAYAALWQFALDIDLIGTIEAERRPIEEPLMHMLADPRRMHRVSLDGIWVRLVNIPAALEARRYASEGSVTFRVTDPFLPEYNGVYRLEGGPDGARCLRNDGPAHIECDVSVLGAVYLGGTRFHTLRAAGRLRGSDEAVRRADAMFTWDPQPWCPEVF